MAKTTYATREELPDCLKAEEVGGYLGISRARAYDLVRSNGFPRIKIGKRIVIPKDAFLAWIERNTQVEIVHGQRFQ